MTIEEYLKDFTAEQKQEFWDKYHEAERIRKKFMKQYKIQHECCPNCGESDNYRSTLVGFAFNSEYPDSYRDLNDATCGECGNRHTIHSRVPKKI